jgi:XTP/dITP diphosphohydrolase
MKIVLATQNPNKRKELIELLPDHFQVLSPLDVHWAEPIAETGDTLYANALIKAKTLAAHSGLPALADDSGLLVDALDRAPGVYSARFAGEDATDQENMDKLLLDLAGQTNRKAYFETVLAWVEGDFVEYFSGQVQGRIGEKPQGRNGFGYDPLFIPDGHQLSFGQLTPETKKKLSHRSQALKAFLAFIQTKP